MKCVLGSDDPGMWGLGDGSCLDLEVQSALDMGCSREQVRSIVGYRGRGKLQGTGP